MDANDSVYSAPQLGEWPKFNANAGNAGKAGGAPATQLLDHFYCGNRLYCYLMPLICYRVPSSGVVPMRRTSRKRSMGKAAKSGRQAKVRHLALQPDALGVATRLAAGRLRESDIVLKPLLRSAGLSVSQINRKDLRIGVASQIRFLELAA